MIIRNLCLRFPLNSCAPHTTPYVQQLKTALTNCLSPRLSLEEQELKLMHQLQEAARERKIPRGVGPLTFEILRREVGDWGRFNNRRQVSSYTGLCTRESSQRRLARWT